MLARSFKMRFIAVIAVLLASLGSFQAAPAQAATGLDYRGTVSIDAVYSVKGVKWKIDGVPYQLDRFVYTITADGAFIAPGYIATDGIITKQGMNKFFGTKLFMEMFRHEFGEMLVASEGYQRGSEPLRQAVASATPIGKPTFEWYMVVGRGIKHAAFTEVAVGQPSEENGYPAIFSLKGQNVPAYSVRVDGDFNAKGLLPLSSRFSGGAVKIEPIERQVDKYGNNKYPYYQVLLADDFVPGTQVVNKSAPRELVGMVGAGHSGEGADALYPMNAWVALAQSKGIPVNVVGQSPVPSVSATTALPSASASPTASPSAAPSASPQPTESSTPSAPAEQDSSVGWIIGIGLAIACLVIPLVWLAYRRKPHDQPSESPRDGEAPKE